MSNFSVVPLVEKLFGPSYSSDRAQSVLLTALCGLVIFAFWYRYPSEGASKSDRTKPQAVGQRRTDYVFMESDIDAVRRNVDGGSVTIAKILVHPIKSCRGISVQETRFTPSGLEHDRTWCIIDAKNHQILTARQIPKAGMVLIVPKVAENPDDPSNSRLEVSFPPGSDCSTFSVPLRPSQETLGSWQSVDDCTVHAWMGLDGYVCQPSDTKLPPALCSDILSKYIGRPVHLIFKGPRIRATRPTLNFPDLSVPFQYQDGYPLLVVSQESFEGVKDMAKDWRSEQPIIDKEVAKHIDSLIVERFRPNIVTRGSGKPFAEDMWRKITIAPPSSPEDALAFDLVSKCGRCMLPNVDPRTGQRNMSVPSKPLGKFRKGLDPANLDYSCFGCNAVPQGSGVLRVGDIVSVKQWADV
ncbi:MOSC N-terminal beta barrel domain-containing protein [Vararia minispora EC-137]|uniref:MOSC N-terminal beta barrel domain-containing protein n=1 Tax=Vararia minispora EC-137 TaxID=1314806 RepID=A0ACB8QZC0_9AGAM|nr:MOSC N-terminal beta barrel domain-containing protein [Vararia minispora EC-137]